MITNQPSYKYLIIMLTDIKKRPVIRKQILVFFKKEYQTDNSQGSLKCDAHKYADITINGNGLSLHSRYSLSSRHQTSVGLHVLRPGRTVFTDSISVQGSCKLENRLAWLCLQIILSTI